MSPASAFHSAFERGKFVPRCNLLDVHVHFHRFQRRGSGTLRLQTRCPVIGSTACTAAVTKLCRNRQRMQSTIRCKRCATRRLCHMRRLSVALPREPHVAQTQHHSRRRGRNSARQPVALEKCRKTRPHFGDFSDVARSLPPGTTTARARTLPSTSRHEADRQPSLSTPGHASWIAITTAHRIRTPALHCIRSISSACSARTSAGGRFPPSCVPSLAGAYTLVAPRQWRATQALIIRPEAASVSEERLGKFSDLSEMKTLQETILELAKSQSVVQATLREVGPPSNRGRPAQWPTPLDVEDFRDDIDMRPPGGAEFGKTEVFYLVGSQFQSRSGQRARRRPVQPAGKPHAGAPRPDVPKA